jgi:hypothetical protein
LFPHWGTITFLALGYRKVLQENMTKFFYLIVLAFGLCLAHPCLSQPFASSNGDLLAGFRKTGTHQANYEVVVNLGNITNFEALAPGTTIQMTRFSPHQLSNAFSDFNFLQWSVSAAFPGSARWGAFPAASLWYTRPRPDPSTQSDLPARLSVSAQQNTRQRILGIGLGASTISASLGTSNENNNVYLVREPIGSGAGLTANIEDRFDPTLGNFYSTLPFSVENTTPAAFSSTVASDLYQVCPTGTTDPTTGQTTGLGYLVGIFQFNPDGTMSFTRASTNSVPPQPPPAPVLTATRSGTTTTISFATTNGSTYALHYTNSAGLGSPVASWPSLPTTITGDGSIKSFMDTTTDADRIYRVGAH